MKLGLLTIQKSPSSYGGNLQCYALWKYLNTIPSINCDVIDLLRPCHIGFRKSNKIILNSVLLDKKEFRQKNNTKAFIKKILLGNYIYTNKITKEFHRLCTYSEKLTIDDLYSNELDYDIYIAGSDQIWNPTQVYPVEPFFLTFTNKKKISYASSVGLSDIPVNAISYMKKWLKSFSFISVREKETADIFSKKIGYDVKTVVDPTLLLTKNEWFSLIEHKSKLKKKFDDYIFIYSLYYSDEIVDFCNSIIGKTDKKIILLDSPFKDMRKLQNITKVGPIEFLHLIKDASYVYTDSFHCSLFSILFGIPFYSMIDGLNRSRISRIENLLMLCGLDNKRLFELDILKEKEMDFSKWDYSVFYKAIEDSKTFLQNSLGV